MALRYCFEAERVSDEFFDQFSGRFTTYCAEQKAEVEETLVEVLKLDVSEPGAVQPGQIRGDTFPDRSGKNGGYIGGQGIA